MKICAECRYMERGNPDPWKSVCFAAAPILRDPITGEVKYWRCVEVNRAGECEMFEKRLGWWRRAVKWWRDRGTGPLVDIDVAEDL